jgi:hypothetical protein
MDPPPQRGAGSRGDCGMQLDAEARRRQRGEILVFGDGFLGQFAEEGEGVGFVPGGFHHHEDGHAEEDGLNEGVEMKPGDTLEEGPQHLIVEEPGNEEVQALKTVEADEAIVTEAAAGQHDEGRNPADARDVAEDRRGSRIDCGQWIGRG